MKVVIEGRIEIWNFDFIDVVFSFLELFIFFQKCFFGFEQIHEKAIGDFEWLIRGLSFLENLIEQTVDGFSKGLAFGWEHLHHLMEVRNQEKGIWIRVEKQLHVDFAKGINPMIFLRKQKNPWEIEDEVIDDFLVFCLGHFNERFPEANAIGLGFEDNILKFFIGLSHEGCGHEDNLVALGCERIDEQFDDSTALLLETELSGVSEDDF